MRSQESGKDTGEGMKQKRKQIIAGALAVVLVGTLLLIGLGDRSIQAKGTVPNLSAAQKENSYAAYRERYAPISAGFRRTWNAAEQVTGDAAWRVDSDAEGRYVYLPDEGSVTWTVEVEQAGRYELWLTYCPAEGNSGDIQRTLLVNGSLPYEEASGLRFRRTWANKGDVQQDLYGNDIRPLQVEESRWETACCRDSEGYVTEPLTVYLEQGQNTLTLTAEREPMLLRQLTLQSPTVLRSYEQVRAEYEAKGYTEAAGVLRQIEGEAARYKSSPTLYPLSDTSTCATEPYVPSVIKLNTIGGTRWSYVGDYLEWSFEVPQSGLYQIAVKARQNVTSGLVSSRRVLIDGSVPFAEMDSISFFYDSDWQSVVLGSGEEPYRFYLEAGTHTLRMEVTLGDMGQVLGVTQDVLTQLNRIYREIIMLTGTSPDTMRNYRFEETLPETVENIRTQCRILESVRAALEEYTGQEDGNAAILGTLIRQLTVMGDKPAKIAENLSYFKTNIGSLGTWVNDMSSLNLEIDYLTVYSPDQTLKSPKAGFFRSIGYNVRRFIDAFTLDYNKIGTLVETDEGNTITVWSSAGRDQMQTLKVMLNDSFTQETGIGVNLELVEDGALLSATVAGIGPDVALGVGQSLPVDYALRGAVASLESFGSYDGVISRFPQELLVPYRMDGSLYALPESISFPVLYYRTDILERLGVEVPQTWDDVIALTTVLSNNNMSFGFPYSTTADPGGGLSLFYSLLMQKGGEVYAGDKTHSLLDSDIAVSAFKQWTNFYLNYGQQLEINFVNRFRTGEIPIGIAAQSVYNTLIVSAPEIKDLWSFTLIPGTERKDGSIDRTALVNSACCVILQSSDKKEAAWQFLDWWTREDIQLRFGREMESVLGASARYPTANLKAYESLPWTRAEWQVLEQSMQNGRCVPEVPGGYFTSRHINNAFRSVVLQMSDVKDTLLDYVDAINREITKKRQEFGLTVS